MWHTKCDTQETPQHLDEAIISQAPKREYYLSPQVPRTAVNPFATAPTHVSGVKLLGISVEVIFPVIRTRYNNKKQDIHLNPPRLENASRTLDDPVARVHLTQRGRAYPKNA